MSQISGECPLRLECIQEAACPKAVIEFDTVDCYPAGVVDKEEYDAARSPYYYTVHQGFLTLGEALNEDDGFSNQWPLVVCDASGALAKKGGMSSRDEGWLIRLGDVIKGNSWAATLRDAAEAFPHAPWATDFHNEYLRATSPSDAVSSEHSEEAPKEDQTRKLPKILRFIGIRK